jgi:hypothetical protein
MHHPQALTAIAIFALASPYATGQLAANFLNLFDYTVDIDARELLPTQEVRDDILAALNPREYSIAKIERQVAGFDITASNVTIYVQPSRIDGAYTRLDLDIEGADVEIASQFLNKKYNALEVSDVYGVYNPSTDKVKLHVPFATALSLMFR